jgi:hypothetical protein
MPLTEGQIAQLPKFEWMESRIPASDAVSMFVPNQSEQEQFVKDAHRRFHRSRWFPVDGGHRVMLPHDGQEFDGARFQLEPRAWDHEHCSLCGESIPAMTLCWVTMPKYPYVLLCVGCHARIAATVA